MQTAQLLKHITPELSLERINEIPVIRLNHAVGQALISLQGAQLLQWQPTHSRQDVLWLSEIEPFKLGHAIRGGIPICFPWFGNGGTPTHGTARISLWQLSDYRLDDTGVTLTFAWFVQHIVQAQISMRFSQECTLTFTNYAYADAQVALHSYFRINDIADTHIVGLPTSCFNSLTQAQENVPSPRDIAQQVDCIYDADGQTHCIEDGTRTIRVSHHQASDVVLWNPWHKATCAMTEHAYRQMVCLETTRIRQRIQPGESLSVTLSVSA